MQQGRDITGGDMWPTRESATIRFERLIREMQGQGYTDNEIRGGLENTVHDINSILPPDAA